MEHSYSLDKFIAAKSDNNSNIIGKLLYYTIGKTLIREDRIKQILSECEIDEEFLSSKFTNTHAFKSATKLLEKKYKIEKGKGNVEIYKIRILDNAKERNGNLVVREVKKEVIKEKKNSMVYLGNLSYDKIKDEVSYTLNPATIRGLNFDLEEECKKIIEIYQYAKECYNENRIVTLLENFVRYRLDASPISIHGKLFFVPIFKNDELAKLEQFLTTIEAENEVDGVINFASIPVMDDEKYIKEYTKEFYAMAEQEIETYMKRFQHFIESGQTSEKILTPWIDKVDKLIDKKKKYEQLFKKNLDELDSDISMVERQIQELLYRIEQKENKEN